MPPRKERSLPVVKNDLMVREVDTAILATKCRVQDVRFGATDDEGTTETFVRIKTQIPNATQPHFIMRKAHDDYVSATSMYRAVFYKSTIAQEKHEMDVVKRDFAARSDDNASGTWIPGTPDAIALADIYGIRPWIQALLDAPTTKSAYPDEIKSPSSASTSSAVAGSTTQSLTATPSRRSTRERSQSPRKSLAASARKAKKVTKDAVDTIEEDVDEVSQAIKKSVKPAAVEKAAAQASETAKENVVTPLVTSVKSASAQVAELASDLMPDESEVKYSAIVDFAAGQSVAEMVAEARAQVEAAQEKDAQALATSGLSSTAVAKSKKRDLDEVFDEEEDELIKNQIISVKRGKMESLEVGLVQEKRKVRALFGLVIGLGATAILPYIL